MIDRFGEVLLALPVLIAASAKTMQEESVGFWEKATRAQKLGTSLLTGVALAGLLVSAGVGLSTMVGLAPRVLALEAQHDTIMANRSATQFRDEHASAVAHRSDGHPEAVLEELRSSVNDVLCEVSDVSNVDCDFWITNGRPDRLRRGSE